MRKWKVKIVKSDEEIPWYLAALIIFLVTLIGAEAIAYYFLSK